MYTDIKKKKGGNYHSHLSELYLTTIIFNYYSEIFMPNVIWRILADSVEHIPHIIVEKSLHIPQLLNSN